LNFNAGELDVLQSGIQRIGVFFRLETDPVVRLWLGVGNIKPGVNAYDPDGVIYQGFGAVQSVPSFKQMINGSAQRVEFTISGVSQDILAVASGDEVRGKRLSIGLAILDLDWSLLGPVKWCANYTADFIRIEQVAVVDVQAMILRSVTLSCGTLLTGRRRPGLAYFSNQDQQTRFPGDRFCERTPVYANGFSKSWPTFPPA
jgi:hypothetical protein